MKPNFAETLATHHSAFVLIFACLCVLRVAVIQDLGISAGKALELGIARGALYDASLALGVVALSQLLHRFTRVSTSLWLALGGLLAIGIGAANYFYFTYFGDALNLWVVQHHLGDLVAIRGSIAEHVSGTGFAFLVVVGFALGTFIFFQLARRRDGRSKVEAPTLRPALALLVVSFLIGAGARATEPVQYRVFATSIISSQVIYNWGFSVFDSQWRKKYRRLWKRGMESTIAATKESDQLGASRRIADAFDIRGETDNPLLHSFDHPSALVAQTRSRFGLSSETQPNIVFVFLESVRALEFLHPEIGPRVFPRTHHLLETRSVSFPQTYSSAIHAGKTVRGLFSTLCSFYPNFNGAATYIAHAGVKIRCLPEVARDNGYETVWLSGGHQNFHGKSVFDTLHGTNRFFDFEYFKRFAIDEKHKDCGYPDKPFLQESVRILEEIAGEGRPLFASLLTLSTHDPHIYHPEAPVPPEVDAKIESEKYRNFISTLAYLDQSLEGFFEALFRSEIGDNTLVFLLGDHSQRLPSPFLTNDHQEFENRFRIPFAVIGKQLEEPETIRHAVHQIDIAPLAAEVMGLQGQSTFLGTNAIRAGRPMIFGDGKKISYRTESEACYTPFGGSAEPFCVDAGPVSDPLFEPALVHRPVEPAQFDSMAALTWDVGHAIRANQILKK